MRMNSAIPLQVRPADPINALRAGTQARAERDDIAHQNAFRAFMQNQGGAVMAGDQNALAQLAGFSPEAALGIQSQRQQMDLRDRQAAIAEERLGMDRQRLNAQLQQQAAAMGAAEAAAEAQRLETAVQRALGAQTPEQFDAIVTQYGAGDLVGRFAEREQIATGFLDIAEQLRMAAGPEPLSGPGKVQADINAGILPEGTELRGGPQVDMSGMNIGTAGGKFVDQLHEGVADDVLARRTAAADAASLIGIINEGRAILDDGAITGIGAPSIVAGIKLAERLGIEVPVDAADNSQAFKAMMGNAVGKIIKQFGAGTGLSDADRQYAEQIVGGDITLNEAALRRILDIGERSARATVQGWQEEVPRILEGDVGALLGVDMPEAYQPRERPAVTGISTMDMSGLLGVDLSTLSAQQLDEWELRWQEVGGE